MRMSDEEYFRSCVAQERHLAQLLGMHNIEEFYEHAGALWHDGKRVPAWTRDWRACGPLIAEYGLCVDFGADARHGDVVQVEATSIPLCDHPDRDHALRFAVVKAVIAQLEHRRRQE